MANLSSFRRKVQPPGVIPADDFRGGVNAEENCQLTNQTFAADIATPLPSFHTPAVACLAGDKCVYLRWAGKEKKEPCSF